MTWMDEQPGNDPDPAGHHRAGVTARAAGELAEAEAAFGRALALDPGQADWRCDLGGLLLRRDARAEARACFEEALRLEPGSERARRGLRLLDPAPRPRAILEDVEAFLGEALRVFIGPDARAWTAGLLRTSALGLAMGPAAVEKAVTARLAERGPAARVGLTAGTAAAAMLSKKLVPGTLGGAAAAGAAAGAAWLLASRTITPLRRHYAALVASARRDWAADRTAWIDGRLERAEREARVVRLLERLCVQLDEPYGVLPLAK